MCTSKKKQNKENNEEKIKEQIKEKIGVTEVHTIGDCELRSLLNIGWLNRILYVLRHLTKVT